MKKRKRKGGARAPQRFVTTMVSKELRLVNPEDQRRKQVNIPFEAEVVFDENATYKDDKGEHVIFCKKARVMTTLLQFTVNGRTVNVDIDSLKPDQYGYINPVPRPDPRVQK